MKREWQTPLVIETAISPLRLKGEPPVFDAQGMIREAKASFAAGAGIVHHHHDYRFNKEDTEKEMIALGKGVLAEYPDALIYGDYVAGSTSDERHAHFPAIAAAGVLKMIPIDPGVDLLGDLDAEGRPITFARVGTTYEEANDLLNWAAARNLPISVGILEPGQIRWAVAQARRGALPAGSIVKIYLCTETDLFSPGRKSMNFGLTPTKSAVDAVAAMLEGTNLPWVISMMGGVIHEDPLARYIIERGGHVRTGLEDACGQTDATNAECVAAIADIARQVGRPVATGAEARRALAGNA